MPIGIKSYGAYLPRWLLPRDLIAKAWDFPSIPGSKAVASRQLLKFIRKKIQLL